MRNLEGSIQSDKQARPGHVSCAFQDKRTNSTGLFFKELKSMDAKRKILWFSILCCQCVFLIVGCYRTRTDTPAIEPAQPAWFDWQAPLNTEGFNFPAESK